MPARPCSSTGRTTVDTSGASAVHATVTEIPVGSEAWYPTSQYTIK